MTNNCNHETYEWKSPGLDWDDEPLMEEYVTIRTTEDIDTHRYRCYQCGAIMYYSGAASDYYEKNIRRGVFE